MPEKEVVISNTSPLINLGRIGRVELIEALFKDACDVLIPQEVLDEIRDRRTKAQVEELIDRGVFTVVPLGRESFEECVNAVAREISLTTTGSLDPNEHVVESYVICLGEELGASFLLLDENAARTIAKEKCLKTMRHLDIIVRCVEKGIISQAEGLSLLEKLVRSGVKYKRGFLNHYRRIWG